MFARFRLSADEASRELIRTPTGIPVIRRLIMIGALLAASAEACSRSTEPVSDGSPVEVTLANLSVPVLAASSDRIYTTSFVDSGSRALDSRSLSGELRWTTSVPACPSGLRCTLAIDGSSNLYLNTVDGLMSRSGSTGELRWTVNDVVTSGIAIGSSGRLYAPGRPFAATQLMHAIDVKSGAILWSSILPPNFDATAALLDEARSVVYAIGRGAVTAFDTQTGAIKWITSRNCFAGSDGALASDGTIYVTCDSDGSSKLIAYDQSGTAKWETSLGSNAGTLSPLIDGNGVVYVANVNSLTALNKDGAVAWKLSGLFRNVTHPAIDAEHNIYIAASRISSVSGRYLISVNNGQIVETKGLFPCGGSLLLNKSGRLYCAEVGLLIYMQTAGNDELAQWSQLSHDPNRTGRR